ncbi:hypothetical protein SLS55_000936 [Diplodia seriata]|uniref:rRNA-processing protein FYV7 n=1 Tax=Diplodia seriata TaxID=420778 RepID=A0ABR3CWR6_9PEZI
MPAKRQHDDHESRPHFKRPRPGNAPTRGGFSVGPANLPDGTHRRKVQKIKKDLIHKAKIKKQYAKIREHELHDQNPHKPDHDEDGSEGDEKKSPGPEPTLELHAERQAMLDAPSPEPEENTGQRERRPRKKQQRPQTFGKEAALGQKRKEEAEARRAAREEADRQRQEKLAARERMRKQMAKARTPGKDGKRRLGREAPVLLERVKRIVGDA